MMQKEADTGRSPDGKFVSGGAERRSSEGKDRELELIRESKRGGKQGSCQQQDVD